MSDASKPRLDETRGDGDSRRRLRPEPRGAGSLWPNFSQDAGLLWILDHREADSRPRTCFYEHARKIEKAVAETTGLSRRAQAALSAVADLSKSMETPTFNIRASSTRTSTNIPRMR